MKKTTLLLLGAAALFVIAPTNALKASEIIIDTSEEEDVVHVRPPLTIRNATDSPLTVMFLPKDQPKEAPPYT
ncbi:MAG TPA: hypothetical protein DD412_00015 [Holosporales bacterium]|nr:hypothetical protein [Holosporales bacterium]